jgi:hypothetical protein
MALSGLLYGSRESISLGHNDPIVSDGCFRPMHDIVSIDNATGPIAVVHYLDERRSIHAGARGSFRLSLQRFPLRRVMYRTNPTIPAST